MPALDFPANPTDGQAYANWIYSTSKGAWQAKPMTNKVTTSSVAPASPSNGDEWYNTEDGNIYVYYNDGNSAQWVQVKSDATLSSTLGNRVTSLEATPSGLVPLTPGSVTVGSGSASIAAGGEVTFTSVSSVSLNNVFNSTYRNYKIIFQSTNTTGGSGLYLRFRSAGADRTTANYYYGGVGTRETGGDVRLYGNGSTFIDSGRLHPNPTFTTFEILSPVISSTASMVTLSQWAIDGTSGFSNFVTGSYSLFNSNDGFTLSNGGGTMSGVLEVYGWR